MHKFTIITISLLILASLTPILNINAASTLFVEIDSQSYSIGDVVPITVFYVTDPPLPGVAVDITLQISTPTGDIAQTTITVMSNAQGEASLSYPFSLDNADPGTYSVTASADGTTSNTETFTVGDAANNGNNGPAFDYSIGLSPSTVTVQAGDDAIFRVLLTYSDPSFSGTVVTIQLTGLGPGMTYQLSGIGDLIIYTTSSTPPGTYPLTIIGSANGVIHQTSGTLIVQEQAQAFEYSISISPASKTLSLGDSGSFTVTVTLTSGDPETVSLSVNGLPGDFQNSFSQASGNPTFTSTLTIDTSSSTSTGGYNFSVTASGGGQSETTGAFLTVSEEADFSISITPPSRIINQGESSTFTVTLNKIGDFNEQITLAASGLPTGVTPSFGPTSGKPAFTSTLNIDTSESTPAGNYTVTVDASGGGKTHSVTTVLSIKARSGEATPEDEVDQDETAQDEDIGTDLLSSSSMRNPRNLLLIIIAILAIIIIVMLVRRQRTPTPMQPAQTVKTADTTVTYCTKCGAQIKPGTTFCSSCGTRIE